MAAQQLCPRAFSLSHGSSSCIFSTQALRAFSTTHHLSARPHKTNVLSLLPASAPPPPPYPYPLRTWYKQADHGLYGGSSIQFGNNVSSKNEIKTRRVWRPNTQFKSLFSVSLDRMLRLRVSARVLRTIDKVGGLDNYVLGTTAQRIKELGEEGWKLRWAVLHSPAVQARMSSSETLRRMVQGASDGALAREGNVAVDDGASAKGDKVAVGGESEEGEFEVLEDQKDDVVARQEAKDTFMSETTRASR